MVEFKKKADKIIRDRWGIEVEHIYAEKNGEKLTYEKNLYKKVLKENLQKRVSSPRWFKRGRPEIYGFPSRKGSWCNKLKFRGSVGWGDAKTYAGIAADEKIRIARWEGRLILPLVEIGWDEAYCRHWCEENDLLSPIYTSSTRGGCWFCHNQGVSQLRSLRKNYPELWSLLLKWDEDSPVTFKADGHTVHDFDRRFQLEDDGFIRPDDKVFRWAMLDQELNYRLF